MRVFLYAGQGSQFVGMGKDLYEKYEDFRSVMDEACFGFNHKKLMWQGPEDVLADTRYTQPCMAVFAAGVTKILLNSGIIPEAACGLSLGEYGALFAAGVWDQKTYLELVTFRGEKMAEAVPGQKFAMNAIIGTSAAQAEEACEAAGKHGFVKVVNYNCPGQYVICGQEETVADAAEYAAEHFHARNVRLKTSGPFHTPYLKPAGAALRKKFSEAIFQKPVIPVAMNVSGSILQPGDDVKEMLEYQVQSPVRFEEDLRSLIRAGADEFVEIGPGRALSGFLTKTARSMGFKVRSFPITTSEDIEKLQDSLQSGDKK